MIAIIAILAAILFPVFAQAREKARQISCLSNTRQYATATLMYVQDYDETLPMSAYLAGTCISTFYQQVEPYVKNNQITQCPSEAQAVKVSDLVGYPCPGTPEYTSYTINHALFVNGFFPNAAPLTLAAVNLPSETIMAYDGNVTFGGSQLQPTVQLVQARHNEQFNANFVDGHSKAIQAKKIGTAPQFSISGVPGKSLNVYQIGANGGFYKGLTECLGLPQ